jgi:hypothetical protein
MPATKITELTAISTVNTTVDPLPIFDVSDTTQASSGTTKKITVSQIDAAIFGTTGSKAIVVDNVAALKALTVSGIADGQLYITRGYYSDNDGGQGAYIYDSASAASDNGGTVIAPTAGSGRFLLQIVGSELNVKQFGAYSDETNATITTSAVTNAFAALPANGGVIKFPSGTYLVNSINYTAVSRFNIIGDGYGVSILKKNSGSSPLLNLQPSTFSNGWSIKNLTLNGNGVSPLINLEYWSQGVMSECELTNFITYGIKLTTGVHNSVIKNRFRDCVNASDVGIIFNLGSGHSVQENSFGFNSAKGIGIDFQEPTSGLVIGPGNSFEPCVTGINIPRNSGTNGPLYAISCIGNFFETCSSNPIIVGSSSGANIPKGITISGNGFAQTGNGPVSISNCEDVVVSGNRFGCNVSYASSVVSLKLLANVNDGVRTLSASDYIDSDSSDLGVKGGDVIIATSGKGIDFSATANGSGTPTSEILKDYEEGTWSPTVLPSSGSFTTVSTANSLYTKTGRLVTLTTSITITNKGTGAGQIQIFNLPYAPVGNSSGSCRESAATGYLGNAYVLSGNYMVVDRYDGSSLIADGHVINLTASYFV